MGIASSYAGIGIEAGSGANLTLQRGISPGTVQITLKANTVLANVPDSGDLIISDGSTSITMEMWVDGDIQRKRSSAGDLMTVTLKDRRWKWKYGYYSGSHNQPDKEGNPVDEKTALSIFQDLRDKIGNAGPDETALTFDVSAVPANRYPAVDWDLVNPVQAMQELCEVLGLAIMLETDDVAYVRALGAGAALPAGSFDEDVTTIATPELPATILIRGSRKVYEEDLVVFEAVGMDTDSNNSAIKAIADLSYAPTAPATWLDYLREDFRRLTDPEEKKLAKKCIYKWYRWNPVGGDAYRDLVLPWMNMRARPSEIDGDDERAEPTLRVSFVEKDPKAIRFIDHILKEITDGWTLDTEKGIIKFNEAKFMRGNSDLYFIDYTTVVNPSIKLTIAYEQKTGTGFSDFYTYSFNPTWPDGKVANCGIHPENMAELVAYYRNDPLGPGITPYNVSELDDYSALIAPLIQKKFWDGLTGSARTYLGMKNISPDGAISSITWRISRAGVKTEVQRGRDDPPVHIPTYKQLRNKSRMTRDDSDNTAKSRDDERRRRETRGGGSEFKAQGVAVDPANIGKGRVAIKNTHATNALAGGMAQRTGDVEPTTGAIEVTRPSVDDSENVVILETEVPAGEYGIASESSSSYIAHTGAGPVVGDTLGSKTDQWEAEVSGNGSHLVGSVDDDGNALGVSVGGGGGGADFCQIVDVGGTQVLKKFKPSDGTLTDFKKDITEVYEAYSNKTLDLANYPDDTFLVVIQDGSGEYFAHPFAQYKEYS